MTLLRHGDVFTLTLLERKMTVALVLEAKTSSWKHLTTPIFIEDVVYDIRDEVLMEQKKFIKAGPSTENIRGIQVDDLRSERAVIIWKIDDINEWGPFDVMDVMDQISILTAGRTLQGREVRSVSDKSFSALSNDLNGGFTHRTSLI
ncbi:uncharacterized protein EDB93DRAFT_1106178 [Suillus bovinus]|uniref:uncharacterized protein n=1 Tax=Suillus bovinus TaxID=48563 RepID=UPI001B885F78|nr:uncharacterized protein EDB93DRAFT_1106178 [Suillus bovinus]KAG2139206.1 hypothetical protein EDB93DRAFT_1106178 [Suillus bovinus]